MDTLTQLTIWKNLNNQRNNLIAQARNEGHTWDEITKATGMTRAAAHRAAQKTGQTINGNPRFHTPPSTN